MWVKTDGENASLILSFTALHRDWVHPGKDGQETSNNSAPTKQKATDEPYWFLNASVSTGVLFVILLHLWQNAHFIPVVTLRFSDVTITQQTHTHTLTEGKSQWRKQCKQTRKLHIKAVCKWVRHHAKMEKITKIQHSLSPFHKMDQASEHHYIIYISCNTDSQQTLHLIQLLCLLLKERNAPYLLYWRSWTQRFWTWSCQERKILNRLSTELNDYLGRSIRWWRSKWMRIVLHGKIIWVQKDPLVLRFTDEALCKHSNTIY